jgi:hypothetical protein
VKHGDATTELMREADQSLTMKWASILAYRGVDVLKVWGREERSEDL